MNTVVAESSQFFRLLLLLLFSFIVVACSSGGGDPPPPAKPSTQSVNGGGVKGPLTNAIVTVYTLDYSQPGFKGTVVASGTTDSSAAIMGLALPLPLTPPYLFEFSSDASTRDLTTGAAPVISTMRTVAIDADILSGLLYATPLTTMATDLAVLNADNDSPYSGDNNGTTTETEFLAALTIARQQVLSTLGFGMSVDVDIFRSAPVINSSTTNAVSQNAVAAYRTAVETTTAVLFNMANSAAQTTDAMLAEVIRDLADGEIDGVVNGSPSNMIGSAELAILTDPNPAALIIPNTTRTVDEVEAILNEERMLTGNSGVDTSGMGSVSPTPAVQQPDIDSDTVPDVTDNCVDVANTDQADVNLNLIGDACETPVSVPDVVGADESAARTTLQNAGLQVALNRVIDNAPLDEVIAQNPQAGTDVLAGTLITLTVSDGPAPVIMPDVVGMNLTDAQNTLQGLGFTNIVVSRINDLTPIDQVIGQGPAANTQIAMNATINLTVSDGVAVVDVVGMTEPDATNVLQAAGLSVNVVRVSNVVPIGRVISQSPVSGNNVNPGSTVTITVSDGVIVPAVIGDNLAVAINTLQAAGLNYSVTRVTDSAPIDEVLNQAPASGSTANGGDVVSLTVSNGLGGGTIPDISGIYRLQFTPAGFRNCDATGPGNADYLQIIPNFIGYMSVEQPGVGATVNVTYHNGVTATGTVDSNGNIVLNNGIRNWVDAHGRTTQIEYDLSGSFTAGSPNSISGIINDMTHNGSANCAQTLLFNAELVYEPLGTENYDGVYDMEMWLQKDSGFSNREVGQMQVVVTDTTLTVGWFDEGYIGEASVPLASFNRATGVITFSSADNRVEDIDGDGTMDDLVHDTSEGTIMLVRDPLDASGRPMFIWFNFTSNTEYLDTTTYVSGNMPPPHWIDNGIETSYSRRVETVGMTLSNHVPLTGSSAEGDFVVLGIFNPPLLGLDASTAMIEVVEDASADVVCAATYSERYTSNYGMPLANMTQEAFYPYYYSSVSCPIDTSVRTIINNGSYTVNVKNGTGATLYSYPITATPTTFAASIPSRRNIEINGARSPRSQHGDVIDLLGFFNPLYDLPVVVPASTDTDIELYRLTFRSPFDENVQADITSATNTFNIPANTVIALAAEGEPNNPGLNMRLTERYNRAGRIAQAHSRWLNIHAGIRGLVNIEAVDPSGVNTFVVLQLALDGSSEVPGSVLCAFTVEVDPLVSCNASLHYVANMVTGNILYSGTPVIAFEIIFSDSVNGTVQLDNLTTTDVWTGTARVVNPELTARSEIRYSQGALQERTYINFLNPIPLYGRGVLSTLSGQDLGAGSSVSLTLWDGDFYTQNIMYTVYPVDGIEAQENLGVISYNTGSNGLLAADRFIIELDNNPISPASTKQFVVDYNAPDPGALFTSGNFPPVRTDFTVRINDIPVTANTGSFGDPIPVMEGDTIELSWPDVTAAPSNTRWQIRMGQVLSSGASYVANSERRTARLDHTVAGSGLSLSGGNWTWTSPADFLTGMSGGTSAIVRFHVRASDDANTIRGQSQGIHFQVMP